MKIGLYNPYLGSTLGGGERYFFTLAKCLVDRGDQVDIFWKEGDLFKLVEERLKINLARVNFVENIFNQGLWKRWLVTRKYDAIFYLSDGSLPFLFARRNFIHMQVPLTKIKNKWLTNNLKKLFIENFICNSEFTKKTIDRVYGVKSLVLYPPVPVSDFSTRVGKENIILGVGRFTQSLHAKKQHLLISSFKELIDHGLKGWRLILVGGALKEDKNYLKELDVLANGYPIEILVNASFAKLREYYARAKIFWHATGFGEDEKIHPEKMEHFGIVVVEAMAAGCVPVVVGRGGVKEIITLGKDGFFWQTMDELKKQTLQLIESPEKIEKMAVIAQKTSSRFSQENFYRRVNEIF